MLIIFMQICMSVRICLLYTSYTLDLEKSSCNNGVELDFDYNTWTIKTNYSNYESTDNTRVKCSLYFRERTFAEAVVDCGSLSKNAGTCITENYYCLLYTSRCV